jgi:two-component system cell cycle response regulator CpdR
MCRHLAAVWTVSRKQCCQEWAALATAENPLAARPVHAIFTMFDAKSRPGLRRGPAAPERRESKVSGTSPLMSKIILAEDDNDMRRFLAKALQNAGYDVVSFDNGLSAYERIREEPFTLLLTDIVMPEMDGIELARRATELDPDLKVMFITGFAAVALNPDNQAPKDAKILSKPFHLRDLVDEIDRMLAA